jgi:transcriptional regulator with XRE-family HTH domain
MKLGYKLFELRDKLKLSQQEIADALNVKQSTYQKWENNKTEPSARYLPKLAEILRTNVMELCPQDTKSINIVESNVENSCNTNISPDSFVEIINKFLELHNSQNQIHIKVLEQNQELISLLKERVSSH